MVTAAALINDISGIIHDKIKLLDATRTQRKRIEKLLVKFTKSYFKGDATIMEAYQVASDEVFRFHLPFILGQQTPELTRLLAFSVFKEIGVDLAALPATDDNADVVATAVVAWAKYVNGGARSRDAAWRVVGELSKVIGEANGQ